MKSLALLAGMALVVDGAATLSAVSATLLYYNPQVWWIYLIANLAATLAAAVLAVVLRRLIVRIAFAVSAVGWLLISIYTLGFGALLIPAVGVTALGGLVAAIAVLATQLRPDAARLALALVCLTWAAWALVLAVPAADVGLSTTVTIVRGVLTVIGGLVVVGSRGPISGTAPRHPLPWA